MSEAYAELTRRRIEHDGSGIVMEKKLQDDTITGTSFIVSCTYKFIQPRYDAAAVPMRFSLEHLRSNVPNSPSFSLHLLLLISTGRTPSTYYKMYSTTIQL